jgi:hypothetical protein
MAPPSGSSGRRVRSRVASAARRTALALVAVLALLVLLPILALVVVGWLEISISAGPWRDRIGAAASAALGRPVTLAGPLELVPTLRPRLKVGSIRIANPPGFETPELAFLGEARLRVDLRALLRKRVRILELSAENVRAYIERTADGRVNYAFAPRVASAAAPQSSGKGPDLAQVADVGFDVRNVSLRQLSVEYLYGPTGSHHYFQLDELTAEAPQGEPIAVAMHGTAEQRFPYRVQLGAGSVEALLAVGQTWPFELVVEFLGGNLRLDGSITRTQAAPVVDLLFGLGAEDLSELERLLQVDLPEVGATGVAGQVRYDGNSLRLSGVRGAMGRTTLEADLAYDLTGPRPRVSGAVSLPSLDLRPLLGMRTTETEAAPRSLLDTYRELEQQSFSLRALRTLDADLMLSVGQWLSLPGDVRDAQLSVQLEDGVLRTPVQATIAQVPLKGEVRIDGAAAEPTFALELGAQRTRLGGLAALLAGIQGMQGDLGRFVFRVGGRGETLGEITRTVDVRLAIDDSRLTYGNVEGGRPVELRLETLDVRLPGSRPLTGRIKGALVGEPFDAQLRAADLPSLARTLRSPLSLRAQATGARLEIDGTVAPPDAPGGTDLSLRLTAPRAGDVARWLGLSPSAQASASLQGRVRIQGDTWQLSEFAFRIGRTALAGDFARTFIVGRPLIRARLDVEQVDVRELETMLPPAQPRPADTAPRESGSTLDIPILPQGIDLTDADLEVSIKQAGSAPAEVRDARFTGRIRDGHMSASPFSAQVAGVPFSGALAIDLRGQVPAVSLWLAAGPVDVGRLLRDLGVARGIDARVDAMRVQLIGRGGRLGEMLEKSALDAEMDAGALTLRDPAAKPLVAIAVDKAAVRAPAGQPVSLTIDGAIDRTPVAIRVATGAVRDFVRAVSEVPFSMQASAAGARLDLTGKVSVPITQRAGELELRIEGERIDTLNELARVQLPAWGPWSIAGRFRTLSNGYEVPDLQLRVGDSRLNGRGSFVSGGVRPRVDVKLTAPRVQLDDFAFGDWSPFEKSAKPADKPLDVDQMRAKARQAAAEGQRLLSPQTLQRLDAYLDVQVDEVLSGQDQLGSGTLHAQLDNGRLEFGPAQVNVPGGSAHLFAAYQPSQTDVAVEARLRVDRFDYGILARRAKPGTDLAGLFSLRFDLQSRAPTSDALMSRADGRVDFAVWPQNMRAGIFDLWAVNVFVALVPAVDPAAESKVNCAIGRFDLRQGKLTHDAILIDTSRMRVAGEGKVDFETETLGFRLAPRAKTAQFFSLATPVGVTGKLTDFKVGVAPGGVAESTVRFLTSVFVVPLQKLGGSEVPRDGSDICTDAMRDLPSK